MNNNQNNNWNNNQFQNMPNNQMPNNMYQPNQLGQQFQRKKSKKPLWIGIIVAILLLAGVIWFFFFNKDIDDYNIGQQVHLALMDKVSEVYESGNQQQKNFATNYLTSLEIIFLDKDTENDYESVNDAMTTVDADLLSFKAILEYENDEQIKKEVAKSTNQYINNTIPLIDAYHKRLTILEDTVLNKISPKGEVQKNTIKTFKKGVTTYKEYLMAYKDYLSNPSNKKYEKAKELHFKAISIIENSVIEYIR